MKKRQKYAISVILFLSILFSSLAWSSCAGNIVVEEKGFEEIKDDRVMIIEKNDETDTQSILSFLNNSGIIVLKGTGEYEKELIEDIGMPTVTQSEEYEIAATAYFKYGNNLNGVYCISGDSNGNLSEEDLIDCITDITDYQEERIDQNRNFETNSTNVKSLGSFFRSGVNQPRGKLRGSFEIFTVQNYFGNDYYTIKPKITGTPGRELASSDSNYQSKFVGEKLNVSFSPVTSSLLLLSYGPARTIGSSSYSVDIGSPFISSNSDPSFSFSYTRVINDTDINTTGGTSNTGWELDLSSEAKDQKVYFEPAAEYFCPDNNKSVKFDLYTSYTLDAWNTLPQDIVLEYRVTCSTSAITSIAAL